MHPISHHLETNRQELPCTEQQAELAKHSAANQKDDEALEMQTMQIAIKTIASEKCPVVK